jgi:tRNA 5-methylaminomethyl-2-thiouridine biosynthesis bifunctional protein
MTPLEYDVIVIGAGINGCMSAYYLNQAGVRVALVDASHIASGGSGAAGAFISPKISKAGLLKEIMTQAHTEALDFYTRYFPQHTLQNPLLHITKSEEEATTLHQFKKESPLAVKNIDEATKHLLTPKAQTSESLFLAHGAVVDAQEVCHALAEGIDFYPLKVDQLLQEEKGWRIGHLHGHHIVLSIGAYPKLLPVPYLTLRGIWGHSIDIQTSTPLQTILHHFVSISPTSRQGIIAIGATHDVHFSPFDGTPYNIEAGREELLLKASYTLALENVHIVADYTGLRSGANDYLPILGSLVDAPATLARHPHLRHGKKVDPQEYVYYPNVTMINGSGGYGFVLAPYLAKRLKEYLVDTKPLDERLSPKRFFPRWAKRQL